ncbi:hypothetical protein JCM3766R1_005911 [Sporobolomyces carnicolor]
MHTAIMFARVARSRTFVLPTSSFPRLRSPVTSSFSPSSWGGGSRRSVATSDLPRASPHDKVPFSAPPRDDTRGELGQIHLPDMSDPRSSSVEPIALKIPLEPDAYTIPRNKSEDDGFPSLREPEVHTVAARSTYPDGGPVLVSNSADDTFEAFEGDHKLGAKVDASPSHRSSSSSSSENEESSSSSESEGRPLNSEERSGLVKLGGIVFVAWLASGLTRPYKPQHPPAQQQQQETL